MEMSVSPDLMPLRAAREPGKTPAMRWDMLS